MYHKPTTKLRNILVHPKDHTPDNTKCGVIYNLICEQNPSFKYIGKTKRTLAEWFKNHKNKDKSTVVRETCHDMAHTFSLEQSKILAKETNWPTRKVKAAMMIKTKLPPSSTKTRDTSLHPCTTNYCLFGIYSNSIIMWSRFLTQKSKCCGHFIKFFSKWVKKCVMYSTPFTSTLASP